MDNYSKFSDEQLTTLLKAGDQTAFSEIYNKYWAMLYTTCHKMLREESDAQDIVQDLFITLWTKRNELDFKTSLSGYLYVTARHKVLNAIRKRKNSDKLIDVLASYIQAQDHSVLEQITEKELAIAIEKEIQNLPEKMREVFEYSRKAYLSNREIADKLGISDKTVKKQIGNAIKVIRLKLSLSSGLILLLIYLFFK
ncbi:RNA polymerase sigma factor [Pedobacter caeni]|uniref:RNA polymerase sigma-70 factor, ECF subfamily n=1 Tax=Pedobacter caeni TaxID=288992 RepID=A0A1M5ISA6_9SPHI|nr:RNA polymerase sigma-70 factor [Pedobacter caeni]SHG30879.1 RNA polymerase sigma-70 factor, ECF subfamily [Pedobacter caeni]